MVSASVMLPFLLLCLFDKVPSFLCLTSIQFRIAALLLMLPLEIQ
jgi:hypothetical protein